MYQHSITPGNGNVYNNIAGLINFSRPPVYPDRSSDYSDLPTHNDSHPCILCFRTLCLLSGLYLWLNTALWQVGCFSESGLAVGIIKALEKQVQKCTIHYHSFSLLGGKVRNTIPK